MEDWLEATTGVHVAIATMAGTIITASCVNGTGTESG